MSGWRKLYYKLLNLPLSILVKSKVIPTDPISEHGIDPTRPVMYVLPYDSKADLLTLRAQCLKHDLPDPLAPLEIDGTLLPRHVFIHDGASSPISWRTRSRSSFSMTTSICTAIMRRWTYRCCRFP